MQTLTTNLRKCCAKCKRNKYELELAYSSFGGDVILLTCDHLEVCKIIDQDDAPLFDINDEGSEVYGQTMS